jgi:hypothetical protein
MQFVFPPEQHRGAQYAKRLTTGGVHVPSAGPHGSGADRPVKRSVMRITIDEELKQVHVSQGGMLLTLQLARARTVPELEATAEALRQALEKARVVVVNGEAIRL